MSKKSCTGYVHLGLMLIMFFSHIPHIFADESTNDTADKNHDSITADWLELQRSGKEASQDKQTLSGPVMQNIYERYTNSFKHPIPAEYKEKNASTVR